MSRRINVGGLYGSKTVSAAAGSLSESASGSFSQESIESANVFFTSRTTQPRIAEVPGFCGGHNEPFHNGSKFFDAISPAVFADYGVVGSVSGQRIYLENLNKFDVFTPEMYVGAEVELRRIVNGVMTRVGSAVVSAANFPVGGGTVSGTGRVVNGTAYEFTFPSWSEPAVAYWFSVAAVSAAGAIGTYSDWVSYTPSVVNTGTATNSFTNRTLTSGGVLDAPANVQATEDAGGAGTVNLSWDAVSGADGYTVRLAYSDPATWPTVNDPSDRGYLELAAGVTPAVGDLAIWRKYITNPTPAIIATRVRRENVATRGVAPRILSVSDRVNRRAPGRQWQIGTFDGDAPAGSVGTYFLQLALGESVEYTFEYFWAGGSLQSFYYNKQDGDVLEVDVWLHTDVAFTATFTGGHFNEPLQNVSCAVGWNHLVLTSDYYIGATNTTAYSWKINIPSTVSAKTIKLAGLKVRLTADPFGAVKLTMPPAGAAYRDQTFIIGRPWSSRAEQALGPAGTGGRATKGGWTAGMHLDYCESEGYIPWTLFEWGLHRDDWLLIGEWIVANASRFERWKLELGNENWNGLGDFWRTPGMTDAGNAAAYTSGDVNGFMYQLVWNWLNEVDGFTAIAEKIEMYFGGWSSQSSFLADSFKRFPIAKGVGIAGYTTGWDTGNNIPDETSDTFRGIIRAQGNRNGVTNNAIAIENAATALGKTRNVDYVFDIYEAGPGYQLNGLNGVSVTNAQAIVQECVQKSRAAALAALEGHVIAATLGVTGNWYHIKEGDYWKSHRDDGVEYITFAAAYEPWRKLGRSVVAGPVKARGGVDDTRDDIFVAEFRKASDQSKRLFVITNRVLDFAALETGDPLYNASDTGTRSVTLCTTMQSATLCQVWTAGIGNMREHNRYPVGKRRSDGGGLVDDPLCVEFDTDWTTVDVPSDLSRIVINDDLGADAGGLRGGNFLMIYFEGVVD